MPQNVEAGGCPLPGVQPGAELGGTTEALLTRLGWFCLEKEEACIQVPRWRPGNNTIPQKNAFHAPTWCWIHVSGGEMGKGFAQPLGDF